MAANMWAKFCVLIVLVVLAEGCSSGPKLEQAEQSRKNVKEITTALIDHCAANDEFPTRFLTTKDGKPGLSWRVAILPDLGEDVLYHKFHLDEAWDSPHNRPLVEKMPAVYHSPMTKAEPGFTHYMTVVGPAAVLADDKPIKMKEITDGTSNTLLIVEANDAVEWTKPVDYVPPKDDPAAGLGKLHPKDYFLAGLADSSVDFVPATLDPKSLRAMFTRNGGDKGETFSWNSERLEQQKERDKGSGK